MWIEYEAYYSPHVDQHDLPKYNLSGRIHVCELWDTCKPYG